MIALQALRLGFSLAVLIPAGTTHGAEGRVERVSGVEASPGTLVPYLEAEGYRTVRSDGSVAAEIWLARQVPKLDDGVLVGLVRLTSEGHDVRERIVPPGTYTLRYSTIPAGDRHEGCMRNPEFVVLIPASEDTEAERRLAYDEMMTLSGQILGRRHPVAWQVQRGRSPASAPAFHEDGNGLAWLQVPLTLGTNRVAFSVYVRGSLSR